MASFDFNEERFVKKVEDELNFFYCFSRETKDEFYEDRYRIIKRFCVDIGFWVKEEDGVVKVKAVNL